MDYVRQIEQARGQLAGWTGSNTVSYSSLTKWRRSKKCLKLRRYWQGTQSKPSIHTVFGTCYHRALQENYRQKVSSGVDLPTDDVLDAFDTEWKTQIRYDPPKRKREYPREDVVKVGHRLLKEYMEKIAPHTQPVEVETPHYAMIAGCRFETILDLVTVDGIVVDHKTVLNYGLYLYPEYEQQPTAAAFCLNRQIVFAYHVAVRGYPNAPDPKFRRSFTYTTSVRRLWKHINKWREQAEEDILKMKAQEQDSDCTKCQEFQTCPAARQDYYEYAKDKQARAGQTGVVEEEGRKREERREREERRQKVEEEKAQWLLDEMLEKSKERETEAGKGLTPYEEYLKAVYQALPPRVLCVVERNQQRKLREGNSGRPRPS